MCSAIVEASNIEAFFHESLSDSVSNQNVEVCGETLVYMTKLLARYARSDSLFERDQDGVRMKPLAILYCNAASAEDHGSRRSHLKELGDLALFISGWFAHSLERHRVGIDYYVQMGECAYDWLSECCGDSDKERVFANIFQELASHFSELRDVISEIHMTVDTRSDSNLLGLYELWQRSGSRRAADLLRSEGIDVLPGAGDPQSRH